MTHQYTYYPGCSLQHNSHAYEMSLRAITRALDIELHELDDWNCCGATEYFSINRLPAYALVARNLARAAQQPPPASPAGTGASSNGASANGASANGAPVNLAVPCSACFLNLHKTDKHMGQHADLNHKVNEALGAGRLQYEPGTVRVRHLLEVVLSDIGLERLRAEARRPLYGVKLAPYYGCLVARPDGVFDSTEQPTAMDHMIEALGAGVADFSLKTFCCGGHMTQISEHTALGMIHRVIQNAADGGADALVTICPMCQLNLDVYQGYANDLFGTDYRVPVLYFSQIIGLALGITPSELGFGQEIVDARPFLDSISDTPPPRARRVRRPKEALPMPVMPPSQP